MSDASPDPVVGAALADGRDVRAPILVVDDEAAMVAIIRATLECADFEVITASDGLDALEKARGLVLKLLVVDLMMPRMGGPETIRALRVDQPGLPVLVVSGLSLEEAQAAAPEADQILHKPFLIAQLLEAVEQTLESRSRQM